MTADAGALSSDWQEVRAGVAAGAGPKPSESVRRVMGGYWRCRRAYFETYTLGPAPVAPGEECKTEVRVTPLLLPAAAARCLEGLLDM
jgi:hypothetical protein